MKFNLKTSLGIFRLIAISEGISYLLLLFIGMPLKYLAHIAVIIKIMGWIHGLLFIGYILALAWVTAINKWSFKEVVIAFLASLIPFGTFMLDKKLKQEYSVKD